MARSLLYDLHAGSRHDPPKRPRGVSTLLLINPNTSQSVTALWHEHAFAAAPAGGQVFAMTAVFGARCIPSEPSATVAAHAVLDAYAAHVVAHGEPGAVLIACFGDPGLLALRELTAVPVFGLAEASMRAAGVEGRYAIVTGGVHWPAMLRRLAWSLGLLEPLAGIVTVERSGAELAADPPSESGAAVPACQRKPRWQLRVRWFRAGNGPRRQADRPS